MPHHQPSVTRSMMTHPATRSDTFQSHTDWRQAGAQFAVATAEARKGNAAAGEAAKAVAIPVAVAAGNKAGVWVATKFGAPAAAGICGALGSALFVYGAICAIDRLNRKT